MRLAKQSQFIPLQNVVYFITLPFLVRKILTFYINYVLLFKCPIPGVKGLIDEGSRRPGAPVAAVATALCIVMNLCRQQIARFL